MKVTRLDHLNLSVRSFDKTCTWYQRIFNFELMEEGIREGVRWGVLRSNQAMLCIHEHPEWELYQSERHEKQAELHMNHFAFSINDREAWEKVIEQEKLDIRYGGEVRWPHSSSWYLLDPNGYEIEVALWDNNQISFETCKKQKST